jgi:hypothetical protein
MAEYRTWCAENLPSWLGYGPGSSASRMATARFDYPQALDIRDAMARHRVRYLLEAKRLPGASKIGNPFPG